MFVDIRQYKKDCIHFIGCGGAGMFPLAIILLEQGFRVSGSDMKSSSNTEILISRGANIFIGHDGANIPSGQKTLVVYSSAVSAENPELVLARCSNFVCLLRGEMLGSLSQVYQRTVAISGSHGKTTVTGMLAHIMDTCGVDAGYMIGGKLSGNDIPARAGNGDIFITEVDESDGTHANMSCSIGLVTNVECDHSWSVGGEQRLYANFQTFAEQSKQLIYVQSDKSDQLFADHHNKEILSFTTISAKQNLPDVDASRLAEWGDYQRANASLAINAAVKLGISRFDAERAMSSFAGVARRMSTHYQNAVTVLIEDYAHHPTEVRVALSALRERFPDFHLTVLFQPHRYARLEKYIEEFAYELGKADSVFITPVFAAWVEKGLVDSADLVQLIGAKATEVSDEWHKTASVVLNTRYAKEIVAVFGAGTVNEVIPYILEKIK